MDLPTTGDLLAIYVISIIVLDSYVAVYSYAYYVRKTNASIELQNQFRSTLKAPKKWLLVGKKTFVEWALVSWSHSKSLEEYFQKTALSDIQFRRISGVLVGLLPTAAFIGIFFVPEKHLMIQFVVFLVVQLYTLIESWHFGYGLIELSQTASKMADSDSQ